MELFKTFGFVCRHLLLSVIVFTKGQDIFQEACVHGGATFTEASGNITSPNFPKKYGNDLRCVWVIETTSNKRIEVSFKFFRLELSDNCQFDFLELYDGSDRYTGARFCGRITPRPFASSSNRVSVIFRSDGSGQNVGFMLIWRVRNRCTSKQFACWNAECIPAEQHCDNLPHCTDNSDEIECAQAAGGSFDECGKQGTAPKFTWSPRIVGGNKAVRGSWPWQVVLTTASTLRIFCGGSVIHQRIVLTAAHCVKRFSKPNQIRVVVGRHSARGNTGEQVVKIKHTILHPQFQQEGLKNDVAILDLETKIVYQQNVRPICFAEPNDDRFDPPVGTTCIAAGFGDLDRTNGKIYAQSLYQARLKILNYRVCKTIYDTQSNAVLDQAQMCAGAPGVDTCQGDSGGPLMCLFGENNDTWYQVGVTSFGVSCAHALFPGIDWTEACTEGITVTKTAGSITSPNYPSNYFHDYSCQWDIVASPNQIIQLQFTDFKLHSLCNNVTIGDYLRILDGNILTYQYCGPMKPVPFTSKHSSVSVQFTSDKSGSNAGFMIIWNMIAAPIPTTQTSINPGVTPTNVIIGKPGEDNKDGLATIEVFIEEDDKSSSSVIQPMIELLFCGVLLLVFFMLNCRSDFIL